MDIGGEGPRSKKRSGGGCPILPGAASPHPTLPCRFIFSKHGLNDYSQVVRWEVMVWRIGRRAARTRESLRMVRDDSTLKRPNSHLNPMKTRTRKEIRMGRRRGQWRLGARRRREEPHSLMRLTSDRPDHRVISQVTVTKFGSADRRRGMQSPCCKAGGDAVGGVGQSPDEIRPSIYVL